MSFLISLPWSLLNWLVRRLVNWGVLGSVRLDAKRVISVGNLQAGGSGKTPLVARIGAEAIRRGLSVCILSRGYGSSSERKGAFIFPGTQPALASQFGDEPALLHELVPGAWIAVGSDRVRAFGGARKSHGKPFDLVLLDDGFQHWKIKRDIDVIALGSASWWSRVHRDFLSELPRRSIAVWTKGVERPRVPNRSLLRAEYRCKALQGRDLWLVMGVGSPDSVIQLAQREGARVLSSLVRRDHSNYSRPEVESWLKSAQSVGATLATTGKDWVKWRELGLDRSQVFVIEPEIELDSVSEREWRAALWAE